MALSVQVGTAIVIQIYPPFKFYVPLILSIFMNDDEFSEKERQKKTFFKQEHSVDNYNFITRASMTSRDLFSTK